MTFLHIYTLAHACSDNVLDVTKGNSNKQIARSKMIKKQERRMIIHFCTESILLCLLALTQVILLSKSYFQLPDHFSILAVVYLISSFTLLYHLNTTPKAKSRSSKSSWRMSEAVFLSCCTLTILSSLLFTGTNPEKLVEFEVGAPTLFMSAHALISASFCLCFLDYENSKSIVEGITQALGDKQGTEL